MVGGVAFASGPFGTPHRKGGTGRGAWARRSVRALPEWALCLCSGRMWRWLGFPGLFGLGRGWGLAVVGRFASRRSWWARVVWQRLGALVGVGWQRVGMVGWRVGWVVGVGFGFGVWLAGWLTSLWVSVSAKCEKKKVKWDRGICVCVCDRL